jgi:hypothetical protein
MGRRKHTQSAWLDIAVFAAVASFFLFSAHSLTRSQAPRQAAVADSSITEPTLAMASTTVDRRPAGDDHSIATFRLDCLFSTNPAPLNTEASLVRIVADLCRPKPVPSTAPFVGKNTSSGEDIVPFLQNGKMMSTNYFTLREGSNQITFELNLGKQKVLRQNLELIRSASHD